jgi:hypothetical protein
MRGICALVALVAACGSSSSRPSDPSDPSNTGSGGGPPVAAPDPALAEAAEVLRSLGFQDESALGSAQALVAAHPDSPVAHYLLACGHMVAGDPAAATAELEALARPDCEGCSDALQNLRRDWMCGFDDAQKAIGARVTAPRVRGIVDAILDEGAAGKRDAIAGHFTGAVTVTVECSLCDPEEPYQPTREVLGPELLDTLMRQLRPAEEDDGMGPPPLSAPDPFFCGGDCCDFHVNQLQHNQEFLTRICLAHDADTVASMDSIDGG